MITFQQFLDLQNNFEEIVRVKRHDLVVNAIDIDEDSKTTKVSKFIGKTAGHIKNATTKTVKTATKVVTNPFVVMFSFTAGWSFIMTILIFSLFFVTNFIELISILSLIAMLAYTMYIVFNALI